MLDTQTTLELKAHCQHPGVLLEWLTRTEPVRRVQRELDREDEDGRSQGRQLQLQLEQEFERDVTALVARYQLRRDGGHGGSREPSLADEMAPPYDSVGGDDEDSRVGLVVVDGASRSMMVTGSGEPVARAPRNVNVAPVGREKVRNHSTKARTRTAYTSTSPFRRR